MLNRKQTQMRVTTSFAAAASLVLVNAAPASAQGGGQVQGAAGGRYFEYRCGPDQVLVGLQGSAGVLIDAVQAVCARVDAAGRIVDPQAQGPVFGGNRPFDKAVACPPQTAVTDSGVSENESNPYAGAIRLTCTEIAYRQAGGITTIELRGSGHLKGYQSPFGLLGSNDSGRFEGSGCPGGYAVGIRGRADQFLSAMGLICGPKPTVAADPNAGHTLGKRKRDPSFDGSFGSGRPTTVTGVDPNAGHTLGKRKRPPSSMNAGSGASISSDGYGPSAQDPTEPPSPLISGTYSTTLAVQESSCFNVDLRGDWRQNVELKAPSGIRIPLDSFNGPLRGSVPIKVSGLYVPRQTVPVALNQGPVAGEFPADFEGNFRNDGQEFNVQFVVRAPLCHLSGTITGSKI